MSWWMKTSNTDIEETQMILKTVNALMSLMRISLKPFEAAINKSTGSLFTNC